MLSISVKASQNRAWLNGGYRTDIGITLSKDSGAAEIPVAALFEQILNVSPNCLLILEQAEVRTDSGKTLHIVKNMRGRAKVNDVESTRVNKGEEVFYSAGVVKTPPLHKNAANTQKSPDNEPDIPFEFAVHTEFAQFEEQNIEHKLISNSSAMLKPIVDQFEIKLLPKLIPAQVHQIRFGIEHFKRTLGGGIASFLGPSVYQRFYLDLTREKIEISIKQDFGSKFGEGPQFEGNVLGPLDFALDSLDLFVGLGNCVASKLRPQ